MKISFDSPITSTPRDVHVTGTVPAYSTTGYLTVLLHVTSAYRDDTFYREINIDPNDTGTPSAYHSTFLLSIVPRVHGADTVTTQYAFSF